MNGALAVSDAGPLHYLALVDCFDILPALFDRVYAPSVVQSELSHPNAPMKVQRWMKTPPSWLEITNPKTNVSFPRLDAGEAAALQIAIELKAALLIDDLTGRETARSHGVEPFGTIGILELAARRNMLVLREIFDRLRETNFFASEKLYEDALNRDQRLRK
jgi:predicted nucleic acid-binding protein